MRPSLDSTEIASHRSASQAGYGQFYAATRLVARLAPQARCLVSIKKANLTYRAKPKPAGKAHRLRVLDGRELKC